MQGKKERSTMEEQNVNFICQLCGKHTQRPSALHILAGYESRHDMEHMTLNICGECTDALFDSLVMDGERLMELFGGW